MSLIRDWIPPERRLGVNLTPVRKPILTDGVYTKISRAHTHMELIREWLWESKWSFLG